MIRMLLLKEQNVYLTLGIISFISSVISIVASLFLHAPPSLLSLPIILLLGSCLTSLFSSLSFFLPLGAPSFPLISSLSNLLFCLFIFLAPSSPQSFSFSLSQEAGLCLILTGLFLFLTKSPKRGHYLFLILLWLLFLASVPFHFSPRLQKKDLLWIIEGGGKEAPSKTENGTLQPYRFPPQGKGYPPFNWSLPADPDEAAILQLAIGGTSLLQTPPESSSSSNPSLPLFVGAVHSRVQELHWPFLHLGVDMRFETFGSFGAVSWRMAGFSPSKIKGMLVSPDPVFHVVQHPLDLSFWQPCFQGEMSKWKALKCNIMLINNFPMNGTSEEQAISHWVDWNLSVQRLFPGSITVHVESINYDFLKFRLGLPKDSVLSISQKKNVTGEYFKDTLTTWDSLSTLVPSSLLSQARELSSSLFFYASSPPIKVQLTHYGASDQIHYLLNFLSTLGYSKERPFRFYYEENLSLRKISPSNLPPHVLYFYDALFFWKNELNTSDFSLSKTVLLIQKDEYCAKSLEDVSQETLTYRAHYDPGIISQRVHWFPLGVRSIFPVIYPSEIKPAKKRTFFFNLIASLSTSLSRMRLLALVKNMTSYQAFIHTPDQWSQSFEGYLGPEDYKNALLDSTFTLAPRGHNVECFRIYEACEAGSIPIIEDVQSPPNSRKNKCKDSLTPFKASNAPFVYIQSWDELPALLEDLLNRPEWVAEQQRKLIRWYREWKLRWLVEFEDSLASFWNVHQTQRLK